ncbi:hypothetical protein [Pseudomonas putida]|uniref:hypothetical protein n=1 Tax=Pseudomonas putida TaxID=303 RepID=UPI0021179221|nr:hypothetical protein [Pseudomonas putida]
MPNRYSVVHLPRVDLIAIEIGTQAPANPMEQFCYRIEDSLEDDYVGGPYSDEREATFACARLNSGIDILYLPGFNRLLMEKNGTIIIESGREIFTGLTRQESEEYASLHGPVVCDRFIDLNRKHKRALNGIEDL